MRFSIWLKASRLNLTYSLFYLSLTQHRLRKGLDVPDIASACGYVSRHNRLERAFAGKDYDRMD